MREEKKKEGEGEAGGVGIVMKSECAKKNIKKREDKGVLNHGGESGDSHANAFRWINIYFLIQKVEVFLGRVVVWGALPSVGLSSLFERREAEI